MANDTPQASEKAPAEVPQEQNADPGLADRIKANEALAAKWTKTEKCPICGTDEWAIGDLADLPVRLLGSEVGTVLTAEKVFPLIPVGCSNCGYTIFFNAHMLFQEPGEDKK